MGAIHRGWFAIPPSPHIEDRDEELKVFALSLVTLPPHERETLRCRSEGNGIDACAERLGVSPYTIKSRQSDTMSRLGVEGDREGRMLRVMYLLGRYDASHT